MKRHARRAVIGPAALVALVGTVLVATHWSTVRDHVEAWWFISTNETRAIEPRRPTPLKVTIRDDGRFFDLQWMVGGHWRHVGVGTSSQLDTNTLLQVLADYSERCVVCTSVIPRTDESLTIRWVDMSPNIAIRTLEENGWRVIDQRFPRRAYVVIRDGDPPQEQGILWDGIELSVPTE
jgi:hypothetical protein